MILNINRLQIGKTVKTSKWLLVLIDVIVIRCRPGNDPIFLASVWLWFSLQNIFKINEMQIYIFSFHVSGLSNWATDNFTPYMSWLYCFWDIISCVSVWTVSPRLKNWILQTPGFKNDTLPLIHLYYSEKVISFMMAWNVSRLDKPWYINTLAQKIVFVWMSMSYIIYHVFT